MMSMRCSGEQIAALLPPEFNRWLPAAAQRTG